MSNKTDAAFHGSTLRDELLRAAPFSDDEGLLRRAAEALREAHAYADALAQAKRGWQAEAWEEGATAGWSESGEGWNAEYPGRPFEARETSNPYRT